MLAFLTRKVRKSQSGLKRLWMSGAHVSQVSVVRFRMRSTRNFGHVS